jgi:hypothetical protein
MKRIIRLTESDLNRLVKRIIKEQQLSQNQRDASFQAGPVSRERADNLASSGTLSVSTENNPIFDCVKNSYADYELILSTNKRNKIKFEYFPNYMSVVFPSDFYTTGKTYRENFFTDGRYFYYADDRLDHSYDKWYCKGARDYSVRDNNTELESSNPAAEQPKATQPIANCAASLSEIKAGSNKILKKGCKTDAVKELQKMLKMDVKHHTGFFGDITKAKVIEFQKNNKDDEGKPLVPDGKVGNKTYEALVKTQTTPNLKGATSAVKQYVPKGLSSSLPVNQ